MTNTRPFEMTMWERIVKAALEGSHNGSLDPVLFKAGLNIDPLDMAANEAADNFIVAVEAMVSAVKAQRRRIAELESRQERPQSTPEPLTPESLEEYEGFGPVA